MTSPVRIHVTGRQTRIQFGAMESVHRRATRPMASLAEAIASLIRIAATVLPRPRSNPGSVSATSSPRSAAGVVFVRGNEPQRVSVRTVSAAFREFRQELRGCLSYRLKSHHLGVWAVAHGSDKTTGAFAWGAKTEGNRCVK